MSNDPPAWAKDRIYTRIEARLGWRDCLLVLFGRTIHVDVETDVERPPARTAGSSRVWVERFIMPWESRGGYAVEEHI